jgi:hypothetical protein
MNTTMMSQEPICLKSKMYGTHLTKAFQDMFNENTFSDVTLVCDDQTQLPAHKIILSACSPVLGKILHNIPHPHPLLYLRGVKYHEMQSVLQFMYLGETTILQEGFNDFMVIAQELQMKEIGKEYTLEEENKQKTEVSEQDEQLAFKGETPEYKDDCYNEFKSDRLDYNCSDCDLGFAYKTSLLRHKKIKHEGVKYSCDKCEYKSTQQGHLKTHQQSQHENVRYSCDQCEYKATRQTHLMSHKQYKHGEIRYSCDQCDYQATVQMSLKFHLESKHEGVRYYCDQCEYQTTHQKHLKVHQQSQHEDVAYSCDQCEYKATQQHNLRRHKQTKHSQQP